MTKRLAAIGVAFALTLAFSSRAQANIIITDPLTAYPYDAVVVGTIDAGTQNSSTVDETAWANYLLSMGALSTTTIDSPNDTNSATEIYTTGTIDYSGTLSGAVQSAAGAYIVPSGYDYVLAKYDGQNAGYVLFYLGGQSATLPLYSYNIWGSATDPSYLISHYTTFNCTNCTSVPDGGSTVTLLGSALFAFGMLARKFRNS
jgi:hypothetical protein